MYLNSDIRLHTGPTKREDIPEGLLWWDLRKKDMSAGETLCCDVNLYTSPVFQKSALLIMQNVPILAYATIFRVSFMLLFCLYKLQIWSFSFRLEDCHSCFRVTVFVEKQAWTMRR